MFGMEEDIAETSDVIDPSRAGDIRVSTKSQVLFENSSCELSMAKSWTVDSFVN